MTEPYTQALSKPATLVAGLVVFVAGGGAALFALIMSAALVRGVRVMRTGESWALLVVGGLFGLFAVVLCTAGYRLLFSSPSGAGSMLPHSLWRVLSVVLGALAIFGLGASLLTKDWLAPMLLSSITMGAFSWWCYRFGRSVRNNDSPGAASNNRWSGP